MPPAAFSPLGRAHVLIRTLRPSKWLRPSLREASGQDWTSPFGQTQGMLFEHSSIFFLWTRSLICLLRKKAKYLKYSTDP
jgi:hypothetical protein